MTKVFIAWWVLNAILTVLVFGLWIETRFNDHEIRKLRKYNSWLQSELELRHNIIGPLPHTPVERYFVDVDQMDGEILNENN